MSCERGHSWIWNHWLAGRALEANVPRCSVCGALAHLDHVEAMRRVEELERELSDAKEAIDRVTTGAIADELEQVKKAAPKAKKGATS